MNLNLFGDSILVPLDRLAPNLCTYIQPICVAYNQKGYILYVYMVIYV